MTKNADRDRGSHGRANSHKNRFYAKGVQRLIIWPHLSKTTEWLLELWWYSLKLICFTIFFHLILFVLDKSRTILLRLYKQSATLISISVEEYSDLYGRVRFSESGAEGNRNRFDEFVKAVILLQHLVLAAGSQLLPTQIIATLMSIPCFSPRSHGFHSDNRSK